jgi:class 3 adenylate cyclase/pimeloyl-ACP methyl ester carboxylesterase
MSEQRQLAAIMFTDIEGYTAQMGADERRAISAVQRSRREQRALVEEYGGKWLQEIGDGALCTFPSAVDAVSCGLEIQRVFLADPDVHLRIGIHEGDIVVSGNDVFGDGVNIASRIQQLANPGSICVSGKVFDEIRNKPDIAVIPLGEQQLKNVDHLVAVYAITSQEKAAAVRSRWRRRRTWFGAVAAAVLGVALFYGADTDRRETLLAGFLLELPKWVGDPIEQEIGFATTSDGVQIAYATSGEGPAVVQVLGWFSNVELQPVYDAGDTLRRMAKSHLHVRYDGRGSGLSDRDVADHSLEARVRDLETVVEALGLDRFAIQAVSAGGPTAITYAARHPHTVTRMAFLSAFARVPQDPEFQARGQAVADAMRVGWTLETPAYRNVFITLMAPNADGVQLRIYNEFLRGLNNGRDAASMMESLMSLDTSEAARSLDLPALVIHARGDQLVPLDTGGRDLAGLIPGARLMLVDGDDHAMPPGSPGFDEVWDATVEFFAEDLDVIASGD